MYEILQLLKPSEKIAAALNTVFGIAFDPGDTPG